jgi:hypothetical protein
MMKGMVTGKGITRDWTQSSRRRHRGADDSSAIDPTACGLSVRYGFDQFFLW